MTYLKDSGHICHRGIKYWIIQIPFKAYFFGFSFFFFRERDWGGFRVNRNKFKHDIGKFVEILVSGDRHCARSSLWLWKLSGDQFINFPDNIVLILTASLTIIWSDFLAKVKVKWVAIKAHEDFYCFWHLTLSNIFLSTHSYWFPDTKQFCSSQAFVSKLIKNRSSLFLVILLKTEYPVH